MNPPTYQYYYGVGLLDDLHNYFPALLYDVEQFRTVSDVLAYIGAQTDSRFNLFSSATRQFRQSRPVSPPPQQSQQSRRYVYPSSLLPSRSVRTAPTYASVAAAVPTTATPTTPPLNSLITETFEFTMPPPVPTTQRANDTADLRALINILFGGGSTLDPVIVRPTAEQLASATQLSMATNAHEQESCAICQDSYTDGQAIRTLNVCHHIFHKSCIDRWFETNVHCPVCRHDIRETS